MTTFLRRVGPARHVSSLRTPQISRRWSTAEARQWSTPLARRLAEAITTTGPIPLASYMRQCLTSPHGGYYTSGRNGTDQFGQKGDFITSPEISQIFGELIGIWIVAEWMVQGRRSQGVELLEVGPGRGTLMDDILRTIRNFTQLASAVEAVHLVEASPSLREAQHRLLCADAPMESTSNRFKSTSKYLNVPVVWVEDIRDLPKKNDKSPFIIAHEFFDALPIHAFQSVSTLEYQGFSKTVIQSHRVPGTAQWRELLVSPTPPRSAVTGTITQDLKDSPPEFQLTLSRAPTPHSLILPEISQRYKALKAHAGATIEICPEALSYAAEFACRIGGGIKPQESKRVPSGAALIIDYGPTSTVPINSLRGIRAHKQVSPFSCPGLTDLSADVDFTALAEAALNTSPAVEVHGPVEQSYFLQTMGIRERAEQLLRRIPESETERRKQLEGGWRRLVDRGVGSMGKVYKAMAIVPHTNSKLRPVGFGGAVET